VLSQQEGNRIEANVPHRCRRAQGDARRRSMRALHLFLSSRAIRRNAPRLSPHAMPHACVRFKLGTPASSREPVRPRVTGSASRPSSTKRCLGRKAHWPPKPTANQEAGFGAEHRDKKKAESSAFFSFGQCEPLPQYVTTSTLNPQPSTLKPSTLNP